MSAAVTLLLAVTFAAAAVAKLRAPQPFAATLGALVARRVAPALGRALPLLELALAVVLVTGVAPRAAALVALGLLTVFSVALGRLRVDPTLPACNCFGGADGDPRLGLVRNALLMLAALAALVWPVDGPLWTAPAAALAGAATVTLGAVCVWLLAGALASTLRMVRA